MAKRQSKETPEEAGGGTTAGLQPTEERPARPPRSRLQESVPEPETDRWGDTELNDSENLGTGAFTPGELGAPDQGLNSPATSPQAAQSNRGPLGQEGQGNRQEDQLAELESIEPDISLGPKDR